MKKGMWLVCVGMVLAILFVTDAAAGRFLRKRLKHADKNNDGKVSAREWHKEKVWERKQKSKVDKAWEEKVDTNNNGRVERGEIAKARRHRYLRKRSDADRAWEKEADKNDDGKVDGKELRTYHKFKLDKNNDGKITAAERHAYWLKRRVVANTKVKKKYDDNEDGYLTWEEAREMLRDMIRIVNTKGRAKVNTDIELEFDANNDGVIDRDEAKAIREALAEK